MRECTVCGYQKEAVEIPAAGTGTSSQPGSSQNGSGGSASGNVQTGEYSSLTFWIALLSHCLRRDNGSRIFQKICPPLLTQTSF